MIATVQLDVIGTTIPSDATFNIYSDSDNFASSIATKTRTELLNSTEVTVPDTATTVRVIPNSGCGNFIDLSLDTGDLNPAFTPLHESSLLREARYNYYTFTPRNIVGDGKDNILIHGNYQTNMYSTNNGDTFAPPYYAGSAIDNNTTGDNSFIINNGDNYIYFSLDTSEDRFYIYTMSSVGTPTLVKSQNISADVTTMYGAWYLNGVYYISTNLGTWRTLSLDADFILNLNTVPFFSMDNYGTHVMATSSDGVYKSTDNGLNWEKTYNSSGLYQIFMDSYTKHIITTNSNGEYLYTIDGGDNYTTGSNGFSLYTPGDFFVKHNSIYVGKAGTKLFYTPDPYVPTISTTLVTTTNASTSYRNSFIIQKNNIIFFENGYVFTYQITPT